MWMGQSNSYVSHMLRVKVDRMYCSIVCLLSCAVGAYISTVIVAENSYLPEKVIINLTVVAQPPFFCAPFSNYQAEDLHPLDTTRDESLPTLTFNYRQ
jgi:hypothetical protein